MNIKGLENCKKFYFIGIGGISMSALAKLIKTLGYEVNGSDGNRGEETENLAFYGIKVRIGVNENDPALLGADVVVYTDAIPKEHKELQQAIALNKRMYGRGEFLAIIARAYGKVITVAGSHGKTTCTSICAHIFKGLGVPFTAHIGGADGELGNFYASGKDFFISEACEYKKNLLKLHSDVAILLNMDKDHMECYQDEQDLRDSFALYCKNAQTAFVCADDFACRGLGEFGTFGIDSVCADYRATKIKSGQGGYTFCVEEYGKELCRIKLNAVGRHNIYNALAAFAAARSLGFGEKEILRGLQTFTAVKRRFERIGRYNGATFICDYAHHPQEITAMVKTAKELCRGELYVVFQPHTYSRTKLLLKEFVESLKPIKNLLVYKTFSAREKYDEEGCALRLAEMVGCLYAENVCALKTWLQKTVREGDVALFLGAGDIYYAAQYLLKELH